MNFVDLAIMVPLLTSAEKISRVTLMPGQDPDWQPYKHQIQYSIRFNPPCSSWYRHQRTHKFLGLWREALPWWLCDGSACWGHLWCWRCPLHGSPHLFLYRGSLQLRALVRHLQGLRRSGKTRLRLPHHACPGSSLDGVFIKLIFCRLNGRIRI